MKIMKNRTRLMFQAMELVKELWPPPLKIFIFLRKIMTGLAYRKLMMRSRIY